MVVRSPSVLFLQYLTTVFDTIEDAILLIGVEPKGVYRLLLANNAFERNSGHKLDESVGRKVNEVVSPASYAKLVRWYNQVVETKQPLQTTTWMTVPSGKQAFDINLIPILNAMGECVQIAAVTQVVTELVTLRHENKLLKKKLAAP